MVFCHCHNDCGKCACHISFHFVHSYKYVRLTFPYANNFNVSIVCALFVIEKYILTTSVHVLQKYAHKIFVYNPNTHMVWGIFTTFVGSGHWTFNYTYLRNISIHRPVGRKVMWVGCVAFDAIASAYQNAIPATRQPASPLSGRWKKNSSCPLIV